VSGRHGRNEEDTVEGLRAQLDQVSAALTAALAQLDRIGAAADFPIAADGTGPLPAVRAQGPRAASHRIPKERRWLKVVPGFAFLAAAVRFGARGLTHHRVLSLGLAAMVGVPAVTAVSTHGSQVIPFVSAAPAAVPGWHTTGVPVPLPAASMLAVTRPKVAVARSRPLVPLAPPCPVPSPSPSPSQSTPSPTPSDPPPSPAQPSWDPQPTYPGGGYEHHRGWHRQSHGWQSSDPVPSGTSSPTDAASSAPAVPTTGTPVTDAPTEVTAPAPTST
jgi:hypothetical protein